MIQVSARLRAVVRRSNHKSNAGTGSRPQGRNAEGIKYDPCDSLRGEATGRKEANRPIVLYNYNVITICMTEVFEAKVRRVGNSLGIIIPKDISELLGFGHGDTIHVAIPSTDLKTRNRMLMALIGIDCGKQPFKREKEDRF